MQDNSKTNMLAARAHPQKTTVFAAPLCGKHCPGPACFLARKVRSQDCEMDRMCGLMNEMNPRKGDFTTKKHEEKQLHHRMACLEIPQWPAAETKTCCPRPVQRAHVALCHWTALPCQNGVSGRTFYFSCRSYSAYLGTSIRPANFSASVAPESSWKHAVRAGESAAAAAGGGSLLASACCCWLMLKPFLVQVAQIVA